jgi:hypothetical protein
MPIKCVDSAVGNAVPLFSQGLAFQNPIAGLMQSVTSSLSGLITSGQLFGGAIIDPVSLNGLLELQSFLPTYLEYTQFVSGVTPAFPVAILTSPFLTPSLPGNVALLSTMTFTQMMSFLSGGLNSQSAMCQTDPSNPCSLVSGIFDSVCAGGTAQLNNITMGIAAIANNSLGMTIGAWVTQTISALVQTITNGITAILGVITMSANYALGKSIQGLMSNPCFSQFLSAVTTPALQTALNFPTNT